MGKLQAGPQNNSKHEGCPSYSELGGHVLTPDFDQIQAKIRRENQGHAWLHASESGRGIN